MALKTKNTNKEKIFGAAKFFQTTDSIHPQTFSPTDH
jgi:hypothetical protein